MKRIVNLLLGVVIIFLFNACGDINGEKQSQRKLADINKPQGIQLANGDQAVKLVWASVLGATQYQVYWSTRESDVLAKNTQATIVDAPSFEHQGLENYVTYYYSISSIVDGVESQTSKPVVGVPQPLPLLAPQNLQAKAEHQRNTLSWDPVPGAAAYSVFWNTQAGVTLNDDRIDNISSPFVHTGLSNGQTVYYRIIAIHKGVDGNASQEILSTPYLPTPTTVTGLVATQNTTNNVRQIELNWSPSSLADNYHIYWVSNDSVNASVIVASNKIANVTPPYRHAPLDVSAPYHYMVVATNASGLSEASGILSMTAELVGEQQAPLLGSVPANPVNITVRSENSQLSLDWQSGDSSIPVSFYNIYWTNDVSINSIDSMQRISGVNPPYTHIGLTNGQDIYYVISALNDAGESEFSFNNRVIGTPQVVQAGVPTNIVALALDAKIGLRWTPVEGAEKYNLYWMEQDGIEQKIEDVASLFTLEGLNNGIRHSLQLSSVDDKGMESVRSEVVFALPQIPAPPAPGNFTVFPGDKENTISWDEDIDHNVTSYNLYWGDNSGFDLDENQRIVVLDYLPQGILHNNLVNERSVYYRLTAVNAGGESVPTIELQAMPQLVLLNAPLNVSAVSSGCSKVCAQCQLSCKVKVDWMPPNNSVAETVRYNLYWSAQIGNGLRTSLNVIPNVNQITGYVMDDLTNGGIYFISIAAVNNDDVSGREGIASPEVSVVPTLSPPGNAPVALNIESGDSELVLLWPPYNQIDPQDTQNKIIVDSYNLYWSTTPNINFLTSPRITNIQSGYRHTGLSNNNDYYYQYSVVNSGGESPLSAIAVATPRMPLPDVPQNVTLSSGDAFVTISWDAVVNASSYNLYWTNNLTQPIESWNRERGFSSGKQLNGLINGEPYYFIVSATNSGGESVLPAVTTAISAVPKEAIPSVPLGLSASASDAQVLINWPTQIGVRYHLYFSTTSGFVPSAENQLSNLSGGVDLRPVFVHATGLLNGQTVFYRLTAENTGGESQASAEISATPQLPVAGAPIGLNAVAGNAEAIISWQPLSQTDVNYNLYWTNDANQAPRDGNLIADLKTPYTHSGLTNGITYYYAVTVSSNQTLESNPSNSVSARPEVDPVITPANIQIISDSQTINLSWDIDPNASRYHVYWLDESGVTLNSINKETVTTASFTHSNRKPGWPYYYIVTAENERGESLASSEILGVVPVPMTGVSLSGLFMEPALQTCIDSLAASNSWVHASDVEFVNCGDSNISDLSGMEYLVNLSWAHLWQQNVRDVRNLVDLKQLTEFSLYENNITDLNLVKGLTQLSRLNTLWLYGNQITDVSMLSELPSLSEMGLGNTRINGNLITAANQITGFEALHRLTTLWLGDNAIRDVSGLELMPSLHSLGLDGSGINNVSDVIGIDQLNLSELSLTRNNINDVSVLSSLNNLKKLYLTSNGIQSIQSVVGLSVLVGLNELWLDSNAITDINTIENLSNLEYLELGSNQLSSIASLSTLTQLTNLILNRNNGLINADLSSLSNLTKLTHLQFENSLISDVSWVNLLLQLQSLKLSNNTISDISALTGLQNLTELSLSGNNITDISTLNGLIELQSLKLQNNPIINYSVLSNFTKLRELNVRNAGADILSYLANHRFLISLTATLSNIPNANAVSGLTNLTSLNLSDNNIQDIQALSSLEKLQNLNLQNNNISDVSVFINPNLKGLTTLNLVNNNITDIGVISSLQNLFNLYLSINTINDFTAVEQLSYLANLRVARNNVSDVNFVSGLSNLVSFVANNNQITDITPLASLSKLKGLFLRKNNIEVVSGLSGLTQLQNLVLSENNIAGHNVGKVNDLASLIEVNNIDLTSNINMSCEELRSLITIHNVNGRTVVRPQQAQANINCKEPILVSELVFEDANLKTCVDAFAAMTNVQFANELVGSLDCSSSNIVNLYGIESLTGITSLNLSQNQIIDLKPLQNLTTLNSLDLSANQVVNVEYLAGLKNLSVLNVNTNQLGSIGIGNINSLSQLTNVTSVDLSDNTGMSCDEYDELQSSFANSSIVLPATVVVGTDCVEPIAIAGALNDANFQTCANASALQQGVQFTHELTSIICTRNAIVDITGIEKFGRLRYLNLSANDIANIDSIQNLSNLQSLFLDQNYVTDLNALSRLYDLDYLSITGKHETPPNVNSVSDLSPIRNLISLRDLDFSWSNVNDIQAISELTKLERLIMANTFVTDLTVLAGFANLKSLDLNSLSPGVTLKPDLDLLSLSGLSQLENLIIGFNDLTDLTLLNNVNATSLKYLYLTGNKLSDTSNFQVLSQFTQLEKLLLSQNQIQTLFLVSAPVSASPNLIWLILNDNLISDITNVVLPVNLERLFLSNNSLGSINGLQLPATITYLELSNTNIQDISSLNNLTALQQLYLRRNNITDVFPLSSLISITDLNLSNNSVGSHGIGNIASLGALTSATTIRLSGNRNISCAELRSLKTSLPGTTILPLEVLPGSNCVEPIAIGDLVITDSALLSCISQQAVIYADEIFGPLDCSGLGITDISGVENLINVTDLNLSSNSITDVSPLANMTQLTQLNLSGNTIVDLNPLAVLTDLIDLNVSSNSVGNLTVGNVDSLIALNNATSIDVSNNINMACPELEALTSAFSTTATTILPAVATATVNCSVPLLIANNFLDANLQTCIDALATPNNWLYAAEVVGTVNCSNQSISDASGTENLINVDELNFLTNNISDLTPIAAIKGLRVLWASTNNIVDVSPLANHPNLEVLAVGENPNIADVTPLATITKLLQLRMNSMGLTNIDWVTSLTQLSYIRADFNSISTLPSFATMPSLRALELTNNSITDLSPLTNMTQLQSILVGRNPITNFDAISGLTALRALDLSGTGFSQTSLLANLTEMRSLSLHNNSIVDVGPLAQLTNISSLGLDSNAIGGQGVGNVDQLTMFTNPRALTFSGNVGMACSDLQTLINFYNPPAPSPIVLPSIASPGVNCSSPL